MISPESLSATITLTTTFRSKFIQKIIFFWVTLLGLTACNTPEPPKEPVIQKIEIPVVATNQNQPDFDVDLLRSEIKNYLDVFVEEQNLHQADSIFDFYLQRDFQPRWISISDTIGQQALIDILALAERNGLLPNTYHYEQIQTNLYNLSFLFFQNNTINYPLWAETELLLSDALPLLSKHIQIGVVRPDIIEDLNYHLPFTDTVFSYSEVFSQQDIETYFHDILPEKNKDYLLLQNYLIKYLEKPDSIRQKGDMDTINKLRVNMERCRWHQKDSGILVYVNTPEFMLYLYNNDTVLMTSKTCVGVRRSKRYKKDYEAYKKDPIGVKKPRLYETPCLKSTISYLVLNPQWRIPSNIAKYEILKHIQRDPNYFDRMSFLVFRDNQLIDPHSVDWKAYNSDSLPFRFEQQAGEKNALGKIKFIFPNKFSVYLHDTPSKSDFLRKDRSVSHGCIRVENYLELALHLLNDSPYDIDYLRQKLGFSDNEYEEFQLQTINLFFNSQKHIWVDYKTAWVDSNNDLHFAEDIYDKDPIILSLLNQSVLKQRH